MAQGFELMQNLTNEFQKKTEFDQYVDQSTGQLQINKMLSALSMAIWGLLMAKARATFQLADIFDSAKIRKKQAQLVYIAIMMGAAQILKLCSQTTFVNNLVDKAEHKIETALNGTDLTQLIHKPIVQAS